MTVVAIDGPAGAGKSTIARRVAGEIGFRYVDTGAMYRAVALAVLREGERPDDRAAVEAIARRVSIALEGDDVVLDGELVGDRIRTAEVTAAASVVSTHAGVRSEVGRLQRDIALREDVVMEGRDVGTVVAPEAEVKIFLTAHPAERAVRRRRQLGLDETSADDVAEALAQRDRRDRTRAVAPLVPAPDAIEVDSSGKTIEEVVAEVAAIARRATGAAR